MLVPYSGGSPTYLYADHLGSIGATTNSSGTLQSWQRFNPWGSVRASSTGGVTQTKKSFTGQYRDDTGLSYYGARYYEPGIGRFVSADVISPGKGNPQNRNRYSYALNNPLFYVDPTGHCVEGYDTTVIGCKQYLSAHAWDVQGDWNYDELFLFSSSISDMKAALGWNKQSYIDHMTKYTRADGTTGTRSLTAIREDSKAGDPFLPARATSSDKGQKLYVYDSAFYNRDGSRRSRIDSKATFVHEQAHLWDFNNGTNLSFNLMSEVKGYYNSKGQYTTIDNISTYRKDEVEDWAETVAILVYPTGYSQTLVPPAEWSKERKDYIRNIVPGARIP